MAKKIVYLDAGHGEDTWDKGRGKGRYYSGGVFEEHHFNADVVRHAQEILETVPELDVRLTQPLNEPDIGLNTRKGRSLDGDLLVSVHANASGSARANGACAFYWHTSAEAKRMAHIWRDNWQKAMDKVGTHGDGLHPAIPNTWTNLFICREIPYTSVLLELGFFTGDNDFEHILTDEYRIECGLVLAKSVTDFFGLEIPKPKKDPIYRVIVDGKQVGAYKDPKKAVENALENEPKEIKIQKV